MIAYPFCLRPVALPKPTSSEFKEYDKEIKILADHIFFREMEDKVSKALLKAEWAKFKFDLDAWKSLVPPSTARGSSEKSAPIPLKSVLQRVVKMKSEYGYPIHSLSCWQKLPYLHQSPMLGQKGVQLRLKGSKRNWETTWRMKCSLLNVSIKVPVFQLQKQKK